jgi:hypothetical protein
MAKAASKPLHWPRGLRETPARLWWFQHFAALPPRMPLARIANQLGINYSLARYYVRMFKYELGDPPEEAPPRRRRRQPHK